MKVQKKSKEKRLNFELNYVRSKVGLTILRLLAESMPQSEIAKKCSFLKTKVNYWAQKFLRNELIRVKIPGKPLIYELTSLGTKILTGSEKRWPPPVIMEDYAKKFRLIKDFSSINWVKLGEPKNWIKMGIKLGRIRVEKTSKNIIVHTGKLQGFNPSYLLIEAGQIIGQVRNFLEKMGLELDFVGFPLHKPIFRFYTAESETLNKLGTFYTKDGSIDGSDGVPHVEWNLETAKNYLEMPNAIKRIEGNLERCAKSLLLFSKGMAEHMKLIKILQTVVFEIRDCYKSLNVLLSAKSINKLELNFKSEKK
jgi:hypothetical protein